MSCSHAVDRWVVVNRVLAVIDQADSEDTGQFEVCLSIRPNVLKRTGDWIAKAVREGVEDSYPHLRMISWELRPFATDVDEFKFWDHRGSIEEKIKDSYQLMLTRERANRAAARVRVLSMVFKPIGIAELADGTCDG